MRHIILVLIFFLSSCKEGDFFEGEIDYKLSVSPEDARIDSISLKDFYGNRSKFLFKKGNFRWNMDSTGEWIATVYNQSENKHYYLIKNTKVTGWKNGTQKTDSIINIRMDSVDTKILGYSCQLLEVKSKLLKNKVLRTRSYYYSPELRVNPQWFAANNDGNYNEIYDRMKAIPLKMIDDFGTFSIIYEATQVTPKRIDDSDFKVRSDHFMEMK